METSGGRQAYSDLLAPTDVTSESDAGPTSLGGERCRADRGRSRVLGADGLCGLYAYVSMIHARGESGEEEHKVGGPSWSFIG
jgi:hypothetical protein